MATKRTKTKKTAVAQTTPPIKKSSLVEVGKVKKQNSTVTIFGIEFEQGNDYGFGKCRRIMAGGLGRYPGDGLDRVWNFLRWEDVYVLWSRHQDGIVDSGGIFQANMFQQQYEILDEDTTTT